MLHNNLNKNTYYNLLIHKYGVYIHFILFLVFLYMVDIHPNNGIYWAFLINLGAITYFIYVNGVALGIKQTALLINQIEDEKERDNIKKN